MSMRAISFRQSGETCPRLERGPDSMPRRYRKPCRMDPDFHREYGDSYRIAGPIVTRLVDDETLKKMGAEKMGGKE